MLFNSFDFLIFFTIVVVVYWLLREHRQRIAFLTLASLFFYPYRHPPCIFLLLYIIILNYFCAIKIETAASAIIRKRFLLVSILGNLAVLGFFKYVNFIMDILGNIFPFMAELLARGTMRVALPLGISFFTFQAMAYNIDVYRGLRAERNPVHFTFFISFFPQLVAGPIIRAIEFLPQLTVRKIFNSKGFEMGGYLILWGLLKKVVIADNLAPLVNEYFAHPSDTFLNTWIAVYAFAFQIYCDFSGYCDVAIGAAKMLGFDIPLNFRQPYLTRSIEAFWRRWHITLSSWFRDYVFIPMGGSRVEESRCYANLLATMVVAGLWHGANYTFIAWGLYHGLILALNKVYNKYINIRIPKIIAILFTFHLVCVGWIFFRAENIHSAWDVLCSAFRMQRLGPVNAPAVMSLVFFSLPLLILQIFERRFSLKQNFVKFPFVLKTAFVFGTVLAVTLFGVGGNDFIYFEF